MGTDDRRERFLDIAERLFAERGLSFSMADVVQEAGASKRTLYEHFSSKEALLEALLGRVVEQIEAGYTRIAAEPGLAPEELVRRILLEGARERRRGTFQRLKEVGRAYPNLYRRLTEWAAEDWGQLVEVISQGAREGAFREVDPVALEILLAGFHRELAARGFEIEGRSLESAMEGMADLVLGGLMPRGGGTAPRRGE